MVLGYLLIFWYSWFKKGFMILLKVFFGVFCLFVDGNCCVIIIFIFFWFILVDIVENFFI